MTKGIQGNKTKYMEILRKRKSMVMRRLFLLSHFVISGVLELKTVLIDAILFAPRCLIIQR
jgi:hypothetical protein